MCSILQLSSKLKASKMYIMVVMSIFNRFSMDKLKCANIFKICLNKKKFHRKVELLSLCCSLKLQHYWRCMRPLFVTVENNERLRLLISQRLLFPALIFPEGKMRFLLYSFILSIHKVWFIYFGRTFSCCLNPVQAIVQTTRFNLRTFASNLDEGFTNFSSVIQVSKV